MPDADPPDPIQLPKPAPPNLQGLDARELFARGMLTVNPEERVSANYPPGQGSGAAPSSVKMHNSGRRVALTLAVIVTALLIFAGFFVWRIKPQSSSLNSKTASKIEKPASNTSSPVALPEASVATASQITPSGHGTPEEPKVEKLVVTSDSTPLPTPNNISQKEPSQTEANAILPENLAPHSEQKASASKAISPQPLAKNVTTTSSPSNAGLAGQSGKLLVPVQVPLLFKGQNVGTASLPKGTKARVLQEDGNRMLVNTLSGSAWITKEQIKLDPAPVVIQTITASETPLPSTSSVIPKIGGIPASASTTATGTSTIIAPARSPSTDLNKHYLSKADLETLAAQGNVAAQRKLNLVRIYGERIPTDDETPREWYIDQAEKGNPEAQNLLGQMYEAGIIGQVNWSKAAEWYQKAAENGDADAQWRLGGFYTWGKGVQKDYANAIKWYQKSADQGDALGQQGLACMYAAGTGVPRDDMKAFEWFQIAALQDYEWAEVALGNIYLQGIGVPADEIKAFEWYKKAAENGNATAQAVLGKMYLNGTGVAKDKANAIAWFHAAANQGDSVSQFFLDQVLAGNIDVAKDEATIIDGMSKAAESGNSTAQAALGLLYENKDKVKSLQWEQKAAEGGNIQAQVNLAWMYCLKGGPKNYAIAVEWYKKAAENGNTEAQSRLGDMYAIGSGVQKDEAKAAEWRAKAAQNKRNLPDTPISDPQQKFFNTN